MSNILINGKIQEFIDYQKTSDDLHRYLLNKSREELNKQNTPIVHSERKIGRNEPCPCGSGLKYKKCHL